MELVRPDLRPEIALANGSDLGQVVTASDLLPPRALIVNEDWYADLGDERTESKSPNRPSD
jgi:hypothetical protein